jgi:hypothetical protein
VSRAAAASYEERSWHRRYVAKGPYLLIVSVGTAAPSRRTRAVVARLTSARRPGYTPEHGRLRPAATSTVVGGHRQTEIARLGPTQPSWRMASARRCSTFIPGIGSRT